MQAIKTFTIGHSPDPDDAFVHYALLEHKIDTDGYQFVQKLADIQTLNQLALEEGLDITAISAHAYAYVADKYALLPCGASMGDGYGPIVIARSLMGPSKLFRARIAIPGYLTSAFLALQLWLGCKANELNWIAMPFDQILLAVSRGDVDAGLIIHEGQLTWADYDLCLCVDLGSWWKQTHGGLPLPLGLNAVHKRISDAERVKIAQLLRLSIEYGLNHREQALEYALQFARGLDRKLGDRFIAMYVNRWTIDLGAEGREAVQLFLQEAESAGLIPRLPQFDWISGPNS